MAAINVLSSDVYSLISAGEVVVNPAGIVKELIENSLDAGANSILIDIVQGGISKIKVVDNGCGIESKYIENAFKPHATSKICTKEDIYKISTLGFRGEALPSIALVSNVQMITKTKEEEYGSYIELEGGIIQSKEISPSTEGTSITVTKLFFNTPARYKFLKTPLQEQREIYKLVCSFILAHPEIEFTLIADAVTKINNKRGDLQTGIHTVYGSEFADNIIRINEKYQDLKLDGVISLPYIVKSNHSWQTIFVNGRSVENDTIGAAVNGAYVDFLMKGKYPCFVLNLSLPYESVDVNISPQKTIVKFNDSDRIYKWIYNIIKDKLADVSRFEEDNDRVSENKINNNVLNNVSFIKSSIKNDDEIHDDNQTIKNKGVSVGSLFKDNSAYMEKVTDTQLEVDKVDLVANNQIKIPKFESVFEEENEMSKLNSNSEIMDKVLQYNAPNKDISHTYEQATFLQHNFKVIGVLFTTYILIEQGDMMYIIDQHAAHERFLFDRLIEQMENKELVTQQLLVPFKVNVNAEEKEFLLDNQTLMQELGVEIQDFGANAIVITQIPNILVDIDITNFIQEVLSDLKSFSRDRIALRHKLATKACKAAIKAGDALSDDEIDKLLDMVKNSTSPLLCPHGRPYVVKITKTQVEKWFKRVL